MANVSTPDGLRAQVRAQVIELFERELGLPSPADAQDLLDQGILDSLGLVNLILALESTYGLRIAMEDLDFDDFRSLDRITDFVVRRVAEEHGIAQADEAPAEWN